MSCECRLDFVLQGLELAPFAQFLVSLRLDSLDVFLKKRDFVFEPNGRLL